MRALTLHLLLAKFFRICRLTDSWMFLQSAVSPAILQIKVTPFTKPLINKSTQAKHRVAPNRRSHNHPHTNTHTVSLHPDLHSAQNTLDGCVLHSHTDTLSIASITILPHEAVPVEAIPPCYDTFHHCHKPHIYIRMTTCPSPLKPITG